MIHLTQQRQKKENKSSHVFEMKLCMYRNFRALALQKAGHYVHEQYQHFRQKSMYHGIG